MKAFSVLARLFGRDKKSRLKSFQFSESASAYINRLSREWASVPRRGDKPRAGFLVTPWMMTAAPFYALEAGLAFARYCGQTVFLWDTANVFFNATSPREIDSIERTLAALPRATDLVRVTETDVSGSSSEDTFLKDLVYEHAVLLQRSESLAAEFLSSNIDFEQRMRGHLGAVQNTLRQNNLDWIFLPGAFWGVSGLYARSAERLGISYISYDSGPGELYIARNGAAAHFPDVSGALDLWLSYPPDEQDKYIEESYRLLDRRIQGNDEYRLQPKPANIRPPKTCDLLLLLNYRADTAALCRTKVFPSVNEWVASVCHWVEQQKNVKLVIRQHPCERLPGCDSHDDWRTFLARFTGFGKTICFVGATDDVNTYDLLRVAKVVLPFTSRVGIEAAILGKPVVLGTHCYYGDCGFCWNADSKEEYFALLDQALKNQLFLKDSARRRAAICYYITEKGLSFKTHFTPQPTDFNSWVSAGAHQLWSEPAQKTLLEIMRSQKSVPFLIERHYNQVVMRSA